MKMNEKLEKLKQKTAIKNLFRNYAGVEWVEVKDVEELKIKEINNFLSIRQSYTNRRLFSTTDFGDLSQWIADRLKTIKISNDIIAHILNADRWMVEIIDKDWKNVIELMLKNGGVCFYDCETQMGICVGFDEDSCYIDVKK